MPPHTKVTIIGFGKLGQALAHVLEEKKEECVVSGWNTSDTKHPQQEPEIARALDHAAVIFIAVPSANFKKAVDASAPHIPEDALIITGTKGFDGTTGKLPVEVLEDAFPRHTTGVLSGPMLAKELDEGLPTKATLASRDIEHLKPIQKLFAGTRLSLELSDDTVGVSLYGILKNVYALALGLSDGLELGANFKSCIALKAIREMMHIVCANGGSQDTIFTEAGLGDFFTTGFSPKSRNYTYGFNLGAETHHDRQNVGVIHELPLQAVRHELPPLAEGVKNIERVITLAPNQENTPLLRGIHKIFIQSKDPRDTLLRVFKENFRSSTSGMG